MKTFYKAISGIFMPLLMPTYGTILLLLLILPATSPLLKWITLGGTVLFTLILPIIPILILWKRKSISNLSLPNKEERVAPYLFTFLGFVFWAFFLFRTVQLPMYVVGAGAGSAISIFLITIINLRWKISAHTTGIGGLTGGVFGICLKLGLNPVWMLVLFIFLSILVGLARVELKAHTPSQVLAGFIVGFLSVLLCILFF